MSINGVQHTPRNRQQLQFIQKRIAALTERRKYVYPFYYTTESTVSLTANQNNVNFDVKIGEHFEAFTIASVSTGNYAMEITEVRSGKTIGNGRFTNTNALGDSTLPTVFPVPYLIPAGSRLRFTFQNLTGSTNAIYITLGGRRIIAPLKDFGGMDREQSGDLIPYADSFRMIQPDLVGAN